MARALWKGSISFGLVNIPIELHTAVRDTRPHFRMLHAKDKSPVRFERVCIRDGHPVAELRKIFVPDPLADHPEVSGATADPGTFPPSMHPDFPVYPELAGVIFNADPCAPAAEDEWPEECR